MNMASRFLIGTIAWALSGIASAAWSSGGGDLFTDATNPWFIQNTTKVTYCIEIDDSNFGQTVDVAREKIRAAIGYWEAEFNRAPMSDDALGAVRIGTQSFEETSCSDAVDIRFQFGVLSQQQANYLRNPTKLVGVAVRTAYDEAQLRGRGFVYIAPTSGPLAMTGPDIAAHPWQLGNGQLLELALAHEMGHVFGVQHVETFPSIMAEDFPAALVQASVAPFFAAARSKPFIFSAPFEMKGSDLSYGDCVDDGLGPEVEAVLGINKNWHCLTLRFASGTSKFEIYASETAGSPAKLIGVSTSSAASTESLASSEPLVITGRQKVFPDLPASVQSLPTYEREVSGKLAYALELASTSSRTVQIVIDYTRSDINLSGADPSGAINLDIFSTSLWQFRTPSASRRLNSFKLPRALSDSVIER